MVLIMPVAIAAWDVHGAKRIESRFHEVPPTDRLHDATPAVRALAARVDEYRRERPVAIEHLLPEGQGGTRFYEELDGAAGMAFQNAAAIGLSAGALAKVWIGDVELHERAHLVHAFLPEEVERLLKRVGPPASGEIAAEDSGQHFAEMAATAWPFIASWIFEPENMCVVALSRRDLEDAERRVPGTAGFVARYFDVLQPLDGRLSAGADVRAAARAMSTPYWQELEMLWSKLDARRRADGTFVPWAHGTIGDRLRMRHEAMVASDSWADRTAAVTYLPWLAIFSVIER